MKETIINWNEYQQQALTTAIYPLKRELEYTVLGLCSEVGELGTAYAAGKQGWGYSKADLDNLLKEAGDCYWYVAAIADALKVNLQDVAHMDEAAPIYNGSRGLAVLDIVAAASEMAGIVKKSIRDNDGFLTGEAQTKLEYHLFRALWTLEGLVAAFGSTGAAVRAKNLNKLADRKSRGVLQGSGDNR